MKTLPLLLSLLMMNPVHAGSKQDRERIAALEARVAQLEAKVNSLAASREAPKPSPGSDAEAMNLLKQASEAQQAGDHMKALALYEQVVAEHPGSRPAAVASRHAQELKVLGTKVDALEVEHWFQGSSSLGKDKATLVVFWEVWCPHCRREVPELQRVVNEWGPKGLGIIGLTKQTRGKTDQEVIDWVAEQEITYPIGREGGAMSSLFSVTGVPAAVVIRDGVVVWRGHPAQLNHELLTEWTK